MLNIFADSFSGGISANALSGAEITLAAQIDGRAGSLLVSIRRFDASPVREEKRRIRKLTRTDIERIRTQIAESLSSGIRLPTIAAAVALSPSQFSRTFHATMGETFSAYVLRVRLDAAMRMMTETDLPLYHIATESGFSDQSNFSRAFAKSAGVSPYKWRLLANERAGVR
jgi:AraC-like DNA-binding protein